MCFSRDGRHVRTQKYRFETREGIDAIRQRAGRRAIKVIIARSRGRDHENAKRERHAKRERLVITLMIAAIAISLRDNDEK